MLLGVSEEGSRNAFIELQPTCDLAAWAQRPHMVRTGPSGHKDSEWAEWAFARTEEEEKAKTEAYNNNNIGHDGR